MLSDRHRRILIAGLALFCAVTALWLYVLAPELGEQYPAFAAGSLRMLPVLAVLWIAFPEIKSAPGALLFIVALICGIAMMFKAGPRSLKFILPAIGVLMLLGYLRRFTSALGGGGRNRSAK